MGEREPIARSISTRSILLGLASVVIICAITPYNDYALNNTYFVGNNLPLGLLLMTFLFAVAVNGPLSKWKPDRAFSSHEMAVAFSMGLAGCTLPSSGLLRYLAPSIVMPFYQARGNSDFLRALDQMNLPRWVFPSFAGSKPSEWVNDPLIDGFAGRWTSDAPIPYAAWIMPILTWGVFLAALYAAIVCMIALVRRQWFEHERLPLPLAQIQLTLIESPARGSFLNPTMRCRSFWLAFGAVFLIHIWRGLSVYEPRYFPTLPLNYKLSDMMGNAPWSFCEPLLKDNRIFFMVVGVTYFLSGSVAFSLWFFFIAWNIYKIILGYARGDPATPATNDEHCGGLIAFFVAFMFVGRHHWMLILRQAIRGVRDGEERGSYISYPVAFWVLVGCIAIMIGWMWCAGCDLLAATVMILLLLALFLVMARIAAETGLVHGQLMLSLVEPWSLLALAGWSHAVSLKSFFLGSIVQSTHYDYRETLAVYSMHGMKLSDQTAPNPRSNRGFIAAIALALVVGYVVSFGSTLWTEYHFAVPKNPGAQPPINNWGAEGNVKIQIVDASLRYNESNYHPQYSTKAHWTFGFVFTGALAMLRLRYAWWPLHPVGFLMLGTYPGSHMWFSIMLGWLAKTIIVKFGGSKFYEAARPFFFGLIIGESVAAGFWMIAGIVMSLMNIAYHPIEIMPGA